MTDQPKHSYTFYHRKCYDIDDNFLVKTVNIIKSRVGKNVDISLSLDNLGSVSSESIEDILADTTIETDTVKSISLSAYKTVDGSFQKLSVDVEKSTIMGSIRLSASGSKDFVSSARSDLTNLIESTSRWYWPLNYSGNVIVTLAYCVISAVIGFFYLVFMFPILEPAITKEYPNIISAAVTVIWLAATVTTYNIRAYLFPSLSIRIGKSRRRAERRDQVRKLIFGTILLGTAVSLFSNQIWENVKPYFSPVSR